MRSTDEHQTPSTRPNFMATTPRNGGSDNILARLERSGDAVRAPWSAPWSRGAKAAAAGAALALVALLWTGWMWMHERLQGQRGDWIVATPMADPPAAAPARTDAAIDAALDGAAGSASTLPPGVLTESGAAAHAGAAITTITAITASAPDTADMPLESTSLEPIPVLPMLADVVEKAPAAPAPRTPARRSTPHKANKANEGSRLAARAAAAKPVAGSDARAAATTAAGKGGDSTADGDVALLSAILLHAPRHSAERARAEAKCNLDKNCTWTGPLPALLQAAH